MAQKKSRQIPKSPNGLKTCSRSHKIRGSGPCPKCWPAGAKRLQEKLRRSS
jgi:hypothetical protein